MAKTKTPYFGLGARGSVGQSITAQKKGLVTILRSKPFPTDPRSLPQLAQRQKYRDAVAVWNAFTQEEKQAWHGVCPGLTGYQCFLRSELKYVEPTPPPEEYTEEQTQHNAALGLIEYWALGQHLLITDRRVSKLGFWLHKSGDPPGVLNFQIRRWTDHAILLEKPWGYCSDLTTDITFYELAFDTPTLISDDVFISPTVSERGSIAHRVWIRYQNTDVKADECYAYENGDHSFNDNIYRDTAYRYKYYLPEE